MIQVRVLAFGVLKDTLGPDAITVSLPDGAAVSDLLTHLGQNHPATIFRGIAVSVNAEYAAASHRLSAGDQVALLPPVSGGSTSPAANASEQVRTGSSIFAQLTRDRIDAESLIAAAKQPENGAVVVFDGIVRNNCRGRRTLCLDYEAYEEMALKQMNDLAAEARQRFGVRHVTIVHRLGRLQIGETSVLIAVASGHRGQAFDACRWIIDGLKKTVPIWKRETFADGAVWADGEPFPADIGLEAADAP